MSTPDKYFGIGGSYRIDASGNRVPDENWPDDVLAASAPINTTATLPEPEAPAAEEPAPAAPAPAKTTKSTPTEKE